MKPLYYFTSIFFLFCLNSVQAQITFAPVASEWYHAHHDGYFHSYYNGDTTIEGHICTKIAHETVVPPESWASTFLQDYTYVSGDTVFVYNRLFRKLTPLYIFNVNEGDTISIPGFYDQYDFPDTTFTFRVDSVRMVLYDTALLKTVYTHTLESDIPWLSQTVFSNYGLSYDGLGSYAERIGCVTAGIYPFCIGCAMIPEDCGCMSSVTCYNDPSIGLKLVSGPCDPPVSVTTLPQSQSLEVYPNPSTKELNISGVPENSIYRLVNIVGMQLQTGLLTNTTNVLNTRDMPTGVYLLEITKPDASRVVVRVVKQ